MFLTQSDKVFKKIICFYSIVSTFLCAQFKSENSDCAKEFAFKRSGISEAKVILFYSHRFLTL